MKVQRMYARRERKKERLVIEENRDRKMNGCNLLKTKLMLCSL